MRAFLSVLLGYIIGYIIIKSYYEFNKDYHGPDSNVIQKKVYRDKKGRYYKFTPQVCICPI